MLNNGPRLMSQRRYPGGTVVLLGFPGAGKTTQAAALAQALHLPAVSTGDLARARAASNSEEGRRFRDLLAEGKLIPDADIVAMMLQEAEVYPTGMVLDGFPRTLAQAEELQRHVPLISRAVLLNVPAAEVFTRLQLRGRADDDAATMAKRLDVYSQQTEPVIEFYHQRRLLSTVDGTASPEEVTKDILGVLGVTAH